MVSHGSLPTGAAYVHGFTRPVRQEQVSFPYPGSRFDVMFLFVKICDPAYNLLPITFQEQTEITAFARTMESGLIFAPKLFTIAALFFQLCSPDCNRLEAG